MIACNEQPKQMTAEDVQRLLLKLDSQYVHHVVSQQSDSMVKMYRADAQLYAPSENAIVGKEGIKNWFQNSFDYGLKDIRFQPTDVQVQGNTIIEFGKSAVGLRFADADTLQYENYKYMHIWEKQGNGSYALIREMWNADMAEGIGNEE